MNARTMRWVALCAGAEALGMTAAAFAARTSENWAAPAALTLVVAGGLVEGTALGVLQGRGLGAWFPELPRARFLLATVLVAGLGWAIASAPAVLAPADGGAEPSVTLIVLGAAGIGLTMGTLLGAAQALVLRRVAGHPWRWVGASTAAWTPAMVVIFGGATTAGAGWATWQVTLWGALTGALAGTLLGLVSAPFIDTLEGPSLRDAAVMAAVRSARVHVLDDSVVVLGVTGRRTGRLVELPAQYALGSNDLVVMPAHADRKEWWRNLERQTDVGVWLRGEARSGTGRVLRPGDPAYSAAAATYRRRWPKVEVSEGQPFVVVSLPRTPG